MFKWLLPVLLISCCSVLAISPQEAAAPAKPAISAEDAAVAEIMKTYVEVFNKHDAVALAEYWAPKAVSVNTESGVRLEGRDAIKAGFEQLYKTMPGCKLIAKVKHYRFLRPDLLTIEGEASLSAANQEPMENAFTILLVKVGENKWSIEHASEAGIPTPATPYDGLKSLEWMIGTWNDETPGVTVESNIMWNDKKTFLIRKYSIQMDGEAEAETGSQIIGWDPRSKSIRSWTFTSDGAFGEGAWSQTDNEWRIKLNHTNSDGSLVSATQIITKVDDNTATVQTVGQEIDGAISPSLPAVKMVKKPAAATTQPSK